MVAAIAQEKVQCRVCDGVILTLGSDGQWTSKHDGRRIRFSSNAQITLDVDCARSHTTRVLVDGSEAQAVS